MQTSARLDARRGKPFSPSPIEAAATSREQFPNVYDDFERAAAYATLEFPGTYYLAYRDLPAIIGAHVRGNRALDFGCGAGRSTRFLKQLGFDAIGIDVSASMIRLAQSADPAGEYRLIAEGDLGAFQPASVDLVLSVFTFDNIPDVDRRIGLLRALGRLLSDEGRLVLLGTTPEVYVHEWTSFTTKDFPENDRAKSGETVRVVMKDVADTRPVLDVLWFHEDYLSLSAAAGLELVAEYRPLGREDEPYDWVSETTIAPWAIYVLRLYDSGRPVTNLADDEVNDAAGSVSHFQR